MGIFITDKMASTSSPTWHGIRGQTPRNGPTRNQHEWPGKILKKAEKVRQLPWLAAWLGHFGPRVFGRHDATLTILSFHSGPQNRYFTGPTRYTPNKLFFTFYENTLMKEITKLPFQIGSSFKWKEYSIFHEYSHIYRRSWAHSSPINTSHNSHFKVEHFFSLDSLNSNCFLNLSLVPR